MKKIANAAELEAQRLHIEKILNYTFKNPKLLLNACVHSSYYNEHSQELSGHNERLEFLGDAVLDLMASKFLFEYYPERSEGELSRLRSLLVDSSSCSRYIDHLELAPFLLLGKGELIHANTNKTGIMADFFEALLGAVYLDGDLIGAETFFLNRCRNVMEDILQTPSRNWKTELQEFTQLMQQGLPEYRLENESGPDHAKIFEISVWLQERKLAEGQGNSKKTAQAAAAQAALHILEQESQKENSDA